MNLPKLPWARNEGIIFKFFILTCCIISILIYESIITKNRDDSFFSLEKYNKRICRFLHYNYNVTTLESLFICKSFIYKDYIQNDWISLKQDKLKKSGVHTIKNKVKKTKKKEWNFFDNKDNNNKKYPNKDDNEDVLFPIPNKENKKNIVSEKMFEIIYDTNNPSLDENILKKSQIIFKKLDSNKNNYIDFNEFEMNVKILSKIKKNNKNILTHLFKYFDSDEDNKLNYIEFLSLNCYDFSFVNLIQILFEEKTAVDNEIMYSYLTIYFTEFFETVINEDKHLFIKNNNLIHMFVENFLKKNINQWDLNNDQMLQIDEFLNFQITLLVEIEYLSNFLQLDYNLDGKIDIPELLYYITSDLNIYERLRLYLINTMRDRNGNNNKTIDNKFQTNLYNYIKYELKIKDETILNIKYLLYTFDVNKDMCLDTDEYKNQVDTYAVLDSAVEIDYY
ncbi:apicoplast calcium binding protein 1 [Hepatocystis sp. ex Piliocolobus tephrosceles]|nr:apicoplast calcium binding protein 1 [Hepatocystis sp. ex Piliocolobus tephrosceles]